MANTAADRARSLTATTSLDAWVLAAALAISLWVHRHSLGGFFSPDDLILLERAQGLATQPGTLWRVLSGNLYFAAVTPWFGPHPLPYLMVNWALHGLNVLLLFLLVRRIGGGTLAAGVAAGLFGTSRLFYTAISQVVGVGELLAATFALSACLALTARTLALRASATVAFVAALASKETVLLLPIAFLLVDRIAPTPRARVRAVAPLLLTGAAWAAYLLASGAGRSAFAGPAYQTYFGFNLFHSLMSFAQWSVDPVTVTPDFSSEISRSAWRTGIWVVGIWAMLAWRMSPRNQLPWLGAAWWGLSLAPVLPLLWQRHLHYLYIPSLGMAVALGAALEWALLGWHRRPSPSSSESPARASRSRSRKRPAPRTLAWWPAAAAALAAGLVLLHAANAETLMRLRREQRLSYVDIPLDPFVRKVELIRRVSSRVGEAIGDRHARIAFYIPEAGESTEFFAGLFQAVLDRGTGLRALHPNLDSVAFVRRWTPAHADFELFTGSVDGLVDYLGSGPHAQLRLARAMARMGFREQARAHLAAAASAYPASAELQSALEEQAVSEPPPPPAARDRSTR